MGPGAAVLVGLRSLVIIMALAVVGTGAWKIHTIHDFDRRGQAVLNFTSLNDDKKTTWLNFFKAALRNEQRIWISVGTGALSFVAMLYIFLALKIDRMKVSPKFLVPLEFLTMLSMAAAFVFSLVTTIDVSPLCVGLDTASDSDLNTFGLFCPMDKGHAAAGGVGVLVLAITSMSAIVSACKRRGGKQNLSFEPDASILDANYDYSSAAASEIGGPTRSVAEEQIGLANSAAPMGGRDFWPTQEKEDTNVSGPLHLQAPKEAEAQMRPARPWSEAITKKFRN
ncbi:hypothetical protein BU24DRAFT_412492 [Aaosphaeria arxii CBS 175.79]|uniref:MARVEL domain-containing protein n=1 Tax=Aaosphaeria arxii CBS 175.79 TaxID=1450172 RepID=A0A6A5XGI3_9PLEO|nr:uncharacterized protein BU24DRAFT_412492 [Aaosphaeria arxii CBS 175.79]KAF2011947.1 hypothetical protein BU24DRAFT_412492 [Aaosphaeria arxii CBS 175.79]